MAESKVTFCRICEASCGLIAEVEDGRVLKLRPDEAHVVSRGYACVKGIRYSEVHNSPDRVQTPLKRNAGRFEPISWSRALSEIGERVRAIRSSYGDQSVGMYVGNPAAFSLPHPLFAQMFLASLGSRNLFTSGSQDCNNKFVVAEAMYGSALYQPVPDIDHTQCFIVLGANPAISHLSFIQLPRPVERLKAIEKRGGKVYLVNPRRTETASQVGEHVFIRPDSDVFLLLSFARELFVRERVDAQAANCCEGLDELRDIVTPWTLERTARVTGIGESVLRTMIDCYLEADGAALYCSTGVNQGTHGSLAYWLINAVNVLSGNVDKRGGLLVPIAQTRGAKAIKAMSRGLTAIPSRIGSHAPVLGSYPAAILPDEIETEGVGQIRAMFVTAGNPLLSCPNAARLHDAFQKLELVVAIDLFRNETGNVADYILPVTSFLERDDVPLAVQGFQPAPYLQHVDAVVPASGETRDEWRIFVELARACGSRMMGSRLLQWWLAASAADQSRLPRAFRFSPRLMYQGVALAHKTTLGRVKAREHGMLIAPNQPGTFLGKRVLRKGKKIDLAPAELVAQASTLALAFEKQTRNEGRLLLIGQRDKTSHNSWMHNVEAFVRGPRSTNYVTLHPDDARRLGMEAGQIAQITSKTGCIRVPVRVSDEVMAGVVSVPHGWGHERADGLNVASSTTGANVNVLTSDGSEAVERLSGMAHLTAIAVEVQPWLGLPEPAPEKRR
jgi:anaerobic selenocysteine-containing dehydrogenase